MTLKQIYRFIHPKFQNIFLDYKVDQKPRFGHGLPPHRLLDEIISQNRDQYIQLIQVMLEEKEYLHGLIERNQYGLQWRNDYLPGLDIIGLNVLLSYFKPKRYFEVGSGFSTIVARQVKEEKRLNTEIISLDPKPRAEIDLIADQVIRQPLEKVDLSIFHILERGDVLFIDNSHRILPNSDSNVFYLEILPELRPGVIVHIHDIYLPYDYPQFMCDRSYSEQYGLAIALLSNPNKYEILLPNFYISEDPELSHMLKPIWDDSRLQTAEHHGGSFWFRVRG